LRFRRRGSRTTGNEVGLGKRLRNRDTAASISDRRTLTSVMPRTFLGPDIEGFERLLRFQEHYESMAAPFDWRFTRDDLMKLLRRINSQDQLRKAA
jgi:hypothetical protein